jgi:HAD superfamily hydrolase (TIGR01490 family)
MLKKEARTSFFFAIISPMIKPIALFDIDNTIYDGFSYFELLEKQVGEGIIRQKVLDDAKISMQKYKSKLQDYETTIVELLDIYATGLKGAQYDVVLQSTKEFYQNSDKFFAYVEPVMSLLRRTHDLILVTGEPQFVAEAVGELYGIKSYYSTHYESDGKFTGAVTNYLASRHEKHDAIKHLMEGHGAKNSFAFGDSEGDIEMLQAVDYSVCLNPTEGLRSIAAKKGWHTPATQEVAALIAKLSAI